MPKISNINHFSCGTVIMSGKHFFFLYNGFSSDDLQCQVWLEGRSVDFPLFSKSIFCSSSFFFLLLLTSNRLPVCTSQHASLELSGRIALILSILRIFGYQERDKAAHVYAFLFKLCQNTPESSVSTHSRHCVRLHTLAVSRARLLA